MSFSPSLVGRWVGLGRSLLKEEEADEVEKKENKTHPLLTSLLFSVRDTLFL
jgi:hypothetical protein